MSTTTHYAALAFMAGVGIPVMATISSQLGLRIGSTSTAATILFFGAFAICFSATFMQGFPTLAMFRNVPIYLYLGGIFVAFYVLSITWLAPRFGIANAIFFVLFGQIISASLIEHFGLFNTVTSPLNFTRIFGITLMIFGLFLSKRII